MAGWRSFLIVAGLLSSVACAGTVKWTASGSVALALGFQQVVGSGDPVEIEFSYNDQAGGHIFRQLFRPSDDSLFWQQEEYFDGVEIDFKVTIEGNTWQGTLNSGSGNDAPRTIEIQDTRVGPETKDFFKLAVGADDGGVFPLFPGGAAGDLAKMSVEFSDESTAEEGPDYINTTRLDCVAQSASRITAARGAISNGPGQNIIFTIDPTTISTELVDVGVVPLKKVAFDPEFEEVILTWESIPDRFYTIEYLADDLCWRAFDFIQADAAETEVRVFPIGPVLPKTQLYRVLLDDD